MRQEWDEPEDPLVARNSREAVYVGVDVKYQDTVKSIVVGDESKGEWLSIDRDSLPLDKCR